MSAPAGRAASAAPPAGDHDEPLSQMPKTRETYETPALRLVAHSLLYTEEFTPTDEPSPAALVARVWAELSQLSTEFTIWLEDMPAPEDLSDEERAQRDEVDEGRLSTRFAVVAAFALGASARTAPDADPVSPIATKEQRLRDADRDVSHWIEEHAELWDELDPEFWLRGTISLLFGAATGVANLGGVQAPAYEESDCWEAEEWSALITGSLYQAGTFAATAAQWFEEYAEAE